MMHPNSTIVSEIFGKYVLSESLTLKNRILIALMTRRMADNSHNPTKVMVDYYAKRAEDGLIITEGTLISQDALGYAVASEKPNNEKTITQS